MRHEIPEVLDTIEHEGFLVNSMAQLNRPTGAVWAVSIFRKREGRGPAAYAYFQSQGADLADALKDALLKGRKAFQAAPKPLAMEDLL